MGRPKKEARPLNVERASTREISDIVGANFRDYGVVEFLLDFPRALELLKHELKVVSEVEKSLNESMLRLRGKGAEIVNKLLLGTIDATAFDIEQVLERLSIVTKTLPQKIADYEKFAAGVKSEARVSDWLSSVSKSPRRGDAALNELLCQLSDLVGPTAVDKMFKRFSELRPATLPPASNVDSIRKRIARQKRKAEARKQTKP